MKKIMLLAVLIITMVASLSAIGSAIYWTSPVMSEGDALTIAKHDLAIIDLENLFNNPQELRKIKKINPEIRVLCYVNFFEIWGNPIPEHRSFGTKLANTISSRFPSWLLKDSAGRPVIFYPGMQALNLSDLCPEIFGYTYARYMSEILMENVLDDKVWDGLFLDNLYDEVSWIGSMDLDRDGRDESAKAVDFAWYRGVDGFLGSIRAAKGSKFMIVGNHLSLFYQDKVDGRMLEEFPTLAHHDWNVAMRLATQWPLVIIQAKFGSDIIDRAFNSSLLLEDAYFCLDQNFPVPEDKLNQLNKLKKFSPDKRGKLTFNPAADTYSRRLGDEVITVKP